MERRRFRTVLAGLTLLGFALRVAYALAAKVPVGFGDDVWFHSVANGLVHGRGFSDPFNSLSHGTIVRPVQPAGQAVEGLGERADLAAADVTAQRCQPLLSIGVVSQVPGE